MKRKSFVLIIVMTICLLSGCSVKIGPSAIDSNDTDMGFKKAIIKTVNDTTITVDVDSYRAGTGIVIINTKDGQRYGVSNTNVTFFNEEVN